MMIKRPLFFKIKLMYNKQVNFTHKTSLWVTCTVPNPSTLWLNEDRKSNTASTRNAGKKNFLGGGGVVDIEYSLLWCFLV